MSVDWADAVRAVSPLAVDLFFDVAGVAVPAALLAAPGGAELDSAASSDALRAFLADNPWEGMGSVTGDNWLLLVDEPDRLAFGQRRGPVGMGSVVTMTGEGFEPTSLGGWGPLRDAAGFSVETVDRAATMGNVLQLQWMNGLSLGIDQVPDLEVARVDVLESPDEVHVLLLTRPTPGQVTGWRHAVGITSTTEVVLAEPLGSRRLYSDARVPAELVVLSPIPFPTPE